MLRREYELSIGCDHPNIIDVYDFRKIASKKDEGGREEEDEFELVMEYVEGRTLTDFLKENPSLETKKRIFSELLNAVAYLHQRRIIHNDLKPDNILISRNGNRVKLIDFGLSDDDAHFELKTLGFTDGYAAPELREDRKSDMRSDIYSLGLIMRCIFGKRYFFISNKCLNPNPAKRFQDISSLDKRWRKVHISWPVPFAIFLLVLFTIGVWALVKDKNEQQQKIASLQTAMLQRDKELNFPHEIPENREEAPLISNKLKSEETPNAQPLPQDIPIAAGAETGMQRKIMHDADREIINEFKNSLSKLYSEALDSISRCEQPQEMVIIFQNWSRKVKELYDSRMAAATDESSKSHITSIMFDESARFDTRFHKYLKEAEDKAVRQLLRSESED